MIQGGNGIPAGKAARTIKGEFSDNDVITSTDMIPDRLLEKIDYVLDGGVLSNESSTIVKIEDNKIVILREGILSDDIKSKFKDYI